MVECACTLLNELRLPALLLQSFVELRLRVEVRLFFHHGSRNAVDELVHRLARVVALATDTDGQLVRTVEVVDQRKQECDGGG